MFIIITIKRKTDSEKKYAKSIKIFVKKKKRQKKVQEKYQHFTGEEKETRHSKNLSEEQKQKLVENRRTYYLTYNE